MFHMKNRAFTTGQADDGDGGDDGSLNSQHPSTAEEGQIFIRNALRIAWGTLMPNESECGRNLSQPPSRGNTIEQRAATNSRNHSNDNEADSNDNESEELYWVEPGSTEIVIEVTGEPIPAFLLQFCGFKICHIRSRRMARLTSMLIVLIMVAISVAVITIVMLRYFSSQQQATAVSNITKTNSPSFASSLDPTSVLSLWPSEGPTFSPLDNDNRTQNINNLIFDVSGHRIYDLTSPQGRAFRWLLKYDEMRLDYNSRNIIQRYSMMVLFYSTNGLNWVAKKGYGTIQHECNWYGVTECLEQDIVSIDLSNNRLQGTLPDEIFMLPSLMCFEIGNNRVGGTIPAVAKTFSRLTLSNNLFIGVIPNSLTAGYFEAAHNMLTGTLPSGLINYKYLQILGLHDNRLTGQIPKMLSPVPRLDILVLSNNDLSGTIPTEIGLSTGITKMFLENNNLNGTIPTSIGNLLYLKDAFLNGNKLSGALPSEFGIITGLESLWIHDTLITGVVPGSVCRLTEKYILESFVANCKAPGSGGINCSCCTGCF